MASSLTGRRARRAVGRRRPDPRRDQPARVDLRDGSGDGRDGGSDRRVDDRADRVGRRCRRVLTHGGSLANLTGLLAARAAAAPDAWREGVDGTLAVLAPPSAHYSVRRSVAMLGLGERSVIALDVDRYERIVPGALEAALERAQRPAYGRWRSRRRPAPPAPGSTTTSRRSAASAPSTASGSMSTPRMVRSALLSDAHRHLLSGIHHADSVVWDAHKMMRAASVCAAILVRDARRLDAAFQQKASYLFYEEAETAGPVLLGRQVECTKAPLGLKIFLNLAFRGERGLGEYVGGPYEKTLRFWELISARDGFECLCRPESNILCFRHGSDSALQVELRERLLAQASLSSQLDRGGGRALAAPRRDGPGERARATIRGTARRDRAAGGRLGRARRAAPPAAGRAPAPSGRRRPGRSQARWRQGSPPAPVPSLAAGRPSSSNSRWSELLSRSSRTAGGRHAGAAGRRQQGSLHAAPRRRDGRAQPERRPRRGPPRPATAPSAGGARRPRAAPGARAPGRPGGRSSR